MLSRNNLRPHRGLGFVLLLIWCFCSSIKAQVLDENGGCQLLGLLPFTDEREGPPEELIKEGQEPYGYGSWVDAQTLGKATFSLMAATEIAVQHFNNRDTSIVPQLAELGTCSITFPNVYYHDSAYVRPRSVDAVINRTREGAEKSGLDPTKALCAVLGPSLPRSHEGVSVVTENLDIPQVAFNAIDMRLSSHVQFTTLARIIPSSIDYATAITMFVQRDVFRRDSMAIVYAESDYGEQYEEPLDAAGSALSDFLVQGEKVIEVIAREELENALEIISQIGFRTILVAVDRIEILETLAEVADDYGLIGDKYIWLFPSDLMSSARQEVLRYEKDSAVDRLLRGAAIYSNQDPFFLYGEDDPFLQVWQQQGEALLDRLEKLHPFPQDHKAYYMGGPTYFQDEIPTEYASFLYDGVIATGIAACQAAKSGTSHVEEVLNVNFDGASGHVQFKKAKDFLVDESNDRDPEGVRFGMFNVRPQEEVGSDGKRGYDFVLTHVFHGNETVVDPRPGYEDVGISGVWKPVEGESFIFYDGSTEEPKPARTTSEWNFLSVEIQAVGLSLMALGLLINVGTGIWVFVMRNQGIVKAAQPEFLYLVCLGSAMVSASLFCLSFDEDKGWTVGELSVLCEFFPWLFILGYLMVYCALFSKLRRLSMLISLRRRTVQFKQVLVPFAIIMLSSAIVLTLWKVFRPFTWVRREISDPTELLETYGECYSVDGILPFLFPLGVFLAIVVGTTCIIAWKLKGVQDSLAESKWIFFGVISHIQFWLIGIPLYLILNELSKDASYLITATLTFIFSTSMVMSVIWPKIFIWARDTYFGGPPPTNNNSQRRAAAFVDEHLSARSVHAVREQSKRGDCTLEDSSERLVLGKFRNEEDEKLKSKDQMKSSHEEVTQTSGGKDDWSINQEKFKEEYREPEQEVFGWNSEISEISV